MYNQIIYWKWDDSDFKNEVYLDKIDDIANRSVFDTLLIGLTWCKPSLNEEAGRDAIAKAVERAHARGLKFLFDIDVRPARQEFFARYPHRRLGIVQPVNVTLGQDGSASGDTQTGESGDHYGVYRPQMYRLLRAYAYRESDGQYDRTSLTDVTENCRLDDLGEGKAQVTFSCPTELAGMNVTAFTVAEYDYPDIFCPELIEFHGMLLDMYSRIPLDGATVDEWGAFPYPGFDFTGAWRRPWYSDSFAEVYLKRTGRDLVLDFLNTRLAPSNNPNDQLKAINHYYEMLRASTVEVEQFFYDAVKRIWGKDAFVGVHPTWYALEEVANTPELWKNGFNWWNVPRDFGQTDEIAIYPVRLSLAHKWGGAVFYNMWYTICALDVKTYWEEGWENLRWGGRTHTLGYECQAENDCVMELSGPGDLESVSEIEELVRLANLFQRTTAKSNVAVIMGYPAAVNWKLNVEDGVHWDTHVGAFCDEFATAHDLFNAGYVCDLIPSYEIDNGALRFENGRLRYGTETYDALVFVRPEFSKRSTLQLLEDLVTTGYPVAIIGRCDQDSEGSDVSARFEKIASLAKLRLDGIDSERLTRALNEWAIERNDVPNGARFQDGSVIICNKGKVHRGQPLSVRNLRVDGHRVEAVCDDAFGIALSADGELERLFGGKLSEVRINDKVVIQLSSPEDLYVERTVDGYRAASLNGRDIEWRELDHPVLDQ